MKTIKLIVLCLSLFLVSHSTFAQLSEKQITFNEKRAQYNDSVQKLKEKEQILQVIDNRIASSSLSVQQKNDLIAQRNIRYKNILKLKQNIQELDSTLKVLKYQIEIEKGLKEKLGGIPIQNERQEIQEWTEDLYARKISPAEYQRRIEELLFNIQRYNSEIANYDSQIANYNSQMNNIKKDLSSKVYEITDLKMNIKNMQKDPNNPYAFSNAVNTIYQREKGETLPNSTKQKIQQTYDVAADIYADKASKKENLESKKENLESEKEKAKKEYDELQKAYDLMCKECPQCCKQE